MSNDEIYADFLKHLTIAEEKHKLFAEGQYQALGVVGEEFGEVVRTVTKEEGNERMQEELMDLLVVTWRFIRGDWKQEAE